MTKELGRAGVDVDNCQRKSAFTLAGAVGTIMGGLVGGPLGVMLGAMLWGVGRSASYDGDRSPWELRAKCSMCISSEFLDIFDFAQNISLLKWLNFGFAASIDITRGHCLPFLKKSAKYFTLSLFKSKKLSLSAVYSTR